MLVVIGGGPYGIAAAAAAIEAGIETVVVGRPLSFWTDNMPAGMYLRSGPDWHLDASQVHTFEAFLDERGIAASDVDPVPIAVFLDYARWFQRHKHVAVRECLVTGLRKNGDGSFLVALDNGETLAAESVVAMHLPRWGLLFAILVMVVVLGFFLPPVSIILMTAPIILPPLRAANFDLIWFGVIMTIVMEMGLIHPPVGLNIFVIKNIAPDIPLRDVMWGVMPFVGLMILGVIILCFVPGIATWFPDFVMGVAIGH